MGSPPGDILVRVVLTVLEGDAGGPGGGSAGPRGGSAGLGRFETLISYVAVSSKGCSMLALETIEKMNSYRHHLLGNENLILGLLAELGVDWE